MSTIAYILLGFTVLMAGLWLAVRLGGARERRRAREEAARTALAQAPAPPPAPVIRPPKDNSRDRLRDRLRERKAADADLASSLASCMTEFGNRISVDEVLRAALQIGYSPTEAAIVMAERQYQPKEIASLLVEEGKFSITELGDVIMPLVEGETLAARAEVTFEVVLDVLDIDDEDEELLRLPVHLGCSAEEAAAIGYNGTDLDLASVLKKLGLCASPDVVAGIAKALDVDLSEDEEYAAMRKDGDVEFDAAAAILKACGEDAATIIATENTYDEFSGDELEAIFSALSGAGFTNVEIMTGMNEADGVLGENALAAIIQGALKHGVPMEDVVSFLTKEEADPDDLDEEMSDLEIGIRTRVDVLHAFLHSKDTPAPTQEPGN
ncbi:MAG: hypothetical protein ABSC29_00680 [Minisyncoccia bacterium]|jgi:hypothetical protein